MHLVKRDLLVVLGSVLTSMATTLVSPPSPAATRTARCRSFFETPPPSSVRDANGPIPSAAPLSPDEFLTLLESASMANGRPLIGFTQWLKTEASAKDIKAIKKSLPRSDANGRYRVMDIERTFGKLYLSLHAEPRLLSRLWRNPLPDPVKNEILKRASLEFGAHSAVEAFRRLDLLSVDGFANRLHQMQQRYPNWIATGVFVGVNAAAHVILTNAPSFGEWLPFLSQYHPALPVIIVLAPQWSLMARKPLPPHLLKKISAQGLDATYMDLKFHYGRAPLFDLTWRLTSRALLTGIMAYTVASILPQLIRDHAPEDIDEDEDLGTLLLAILVDWLESSPLPLLLSETQWAKDIEEKQRLEIERATQELLDSAGATTN